MPDDATPRPLDRRSRSAGLSLDARLALVEAELGEMRAVREREHHENQVILRTIADDGRETKAAVKQLVSGQHAHEGRIESLEETRQQQRGALRFIQIFVSLSVVVPVLLAIAHVLTMGHL